MRKGRINQTMRRKLHAMNRAEERLGMTLTHRELKALSARVRSGRFLQARGTVEIWRIDVADGVCDVAFDPIKSTIVSFLPLKTVGS